MLWWCIGTIGWGRGKRQWVTADSEYVRDFFQATSCPNHGYYSSYMGYVYAKYSPSFIAVLEWEVGRRYGQPRPNERNRGYSAQMNGHVDH